MDKSMVNMCMKINEVISQTTIIEGRDAPLYHFCDSGKLYNAIDNNTLKGTWNHNLKQWLGPRYEKVRGTSLTRNKKLSWDYTRIRLTLNQSIIFRTNKIITVNGQYAYYGASNMHPSKVKNDDFISRSRWDSEHDLDEEFVVGDIKNLNKALLEIKVIIDVSNDPVFEYKMIKSFESNKLFDYVETHKIPLIDFKGNSIRRERVIEVEQDPTVIDWLEN